MSRVHVQKLSRKWHRALAPLIGVQLLFWTLGGIYFSWFNLDDVHGDYERSEQVVVDLRDLTEVVPIETLLAKSGLNRVEDVRLGSFLGRPVVRLYESSDQVEMYEARTGEKLSPITEAQAREVAEADFAPEAEIGAVRMVGEKRGGYKNAVPAYQVRFDNWKRTHLYVNANTGLVTARRDSIWRGFDFLWMLHILDFKERDDFNNWLLRVLSGLGLVTVLSGYVRWVVTTPLFRRKRGRDGRPADRAASP